MILMSKPLTLEQTAFIKVVTQLFAHQDVIHLITSLCRDERDPHRDRNRLGLILDAIHDKLQKLDWNVLLMPDALNIVYPIAVEIIKWFQHHHFNRSERIHIVKDLTKICWTSVGTIDRARSSLLLVRSDFYEIEERFKLACTYCLEEEIIRLWNEMSEEVKRSFHDKAVSGTLDELIYTYWVLKINDDLSELPTSDEQSKTFLQKLFLHSALYNNLTVVQYVWKNMTKEEKEPSLLMLALHQCNRNKTIFPAQFSTVLHFIISQMDEATRTKSFDNYKYTIFTFYVHWPYQGYFFEIAKEIKKFISENDFANLLYYLLSYKEVNRYWVHHEYVEHMWEINGHAYRQYVLKKCTDLFANCLFDKLLNFGDCYTINLFLREADVKLKETIVVCGLPFIKMLFDKYNWSLLRYFLGKGLVNVSALRRFQGNFFQILMRNYAYDAIRSRMEVFDAIIDELVLYAVKE